MAAFPLPLVPLFSLFSRLPEMLFTRTKIPNLPGKGVGSDYKMFIFIKRKSYLIIALHHEAAWCVSKEVFIELRVVHSCCVKTTICGNTLWFWKRTKASRLNNNYKPLICLTERKTTHYMKCVMIDSALSIIKFINKVTELKHGLMCKRTQQLSICLIQTQTVSGKE